MVDTPSNSNLATAVRTLAECRATAAAAREALRAREEEFRQANAAVLEQDLSAQKALAQADQMLRQLVVAYYHASARLSQDGVGDKQPLPGVGVKVNTSFEYPAADALAWATEKGLCLLPAQLDVKGFMDLCKTPSVRPAFVKVIETPVPSIATDLQKAIEALDGGAVIPAVESTEAPATAGDVA